MVDVETDPYADSRQQLVWKSSGPELIDFGIRLAFDRLDRRTRAQRTDYDLVAFSRSQRVATPKMVMLQVVWLRRKCAMRADTEKYLALRRGSKRSVVAGPEINKGNLKDSRLKDTGRGREQVAALRE